MNIEQSDSVRAWKSPGWARSALRSSETETKVVGKPQEAPGNSWINSPVISHATKNVGLTIYEMLGMAELMRVAYEKGELASVQDRLAILVTEAADLASSVSDILELKKIEAGPDGAVSERFDIIALLHETTEAARFLAGDKEVAVMDVSCPSPVVIHSDSFAIRRIMTGLLSNAVKFTDRGRIALIMSREEGELKLTVADTGRGMTPDQIGSVLDASDHGYDAEINGLATPGLGLRIVKAMIRKLDGKLAIASRSGEGTIVTVSLPLKSPV